MATFTTSEYGKYTSLQNVSGSGDPASAPAGGVYLFASGSTGAAKLYLQNEGSSSPLDVANLSVDIDSFSALGGTGIDQADNLLFSDAGTEKKITFSNFEDAIFGNVSGDAAIAAGGALTIAAGAVENSMLADDAVDSDELAAGAVDLAHMSANSVDSDQYVDGSIDLIHMSANSVDSDQYVDGSVDNVHLANSATTIGSTSVSLGATSTTLSGLTGLDFTAANASLAASIGANTLTVGHGSSTVAVANDLTVAGGLVLTGDLTVNGTTATVNSTVVAIDDKVMVFASGSADAAIASAGGAGWAVGGDTGAAMKASFLYDGVDSFDVSDHLNLASSQEFKINNASILSATTLGSSVVASSLTSVGTIATGVWQGTTIKTAYIQDANITLAKMAANSVDSDQYVDASIDTAHIGNDQITNALMADDAIDSAQLAAGAVDLAHMSVNSVDSDQYVDGSIDLIHMSANSVDSDQYVDGSIDLIHMSANSVDSDQYVDGSIDEAHLADDAVTADKLASDAVVNASVASGAAIVATKLNFNVDLGGSIQFGTQTDDAVAFGGPIKVGGNAIADSSGNAALTFDGSLGASFKGAMTGPSGYASGDFAITTGGAFSAAGDMIIGTAGDSNGADFTAHGDATGEKAFYSAANNIFQVTGSATGLQVSIGGDATSEYAVDVVNGSNNNNKIRAAAFVTYSDESLKSDVASMSNTALDTVMSLNGVEFTWKDSGERDFGFIAQDVQSVLPKAVHVAEDGVQGVDYSRLTSVLVEAVKAQQVQIDDLKNVITNLKK
jgi:hypothetical protein